MKLGEISSSIHIFTFLTISSFIISVVSSPLQYCQVDKLQRTDQCLALSSYYNDSSNANDFYMLISARFEDRRGFAAFGTGKTMDGALMFVVYPGESEGDVTMSLRTTNYHYPPSPSQILPDYKILKTSVEGDYHSVQLVCYSCDQWTRNSAKVTSKSQAWIFSNHYDYIMQSNDVTKPLSLHTNYDIFELDMTVSHYIGSPPVAPELVENSRKSIGVTNPSSWTSRQLFAIHGLLLAFSFVFMMPLGIAGIRSGSKKSFKIHWIIQVSAVCIAIIAIFLGIYLAWGNPVRMTTLHGSHKLIGFLVLLSLVLTPLFGYLHHVRYLQFGRATGITAWHRRLGASVLVGGWCNVLLGLLIAKKSIWYFAIGFALILGASFFIYLAPKLLASVNAKKMMNVVEYGTNKDADDEQGLLKEASKEES